MGSRLLLILYTEERTGPRRTATNLLKAFGQAFGFKLPHRGPVGSPVSLSLVKYTGYCCYRLHDCYYSCASESSAEETRVLKSKLPPIKSLGEWEAEKSLVM